MKFESQMFSPDKTNHASVHNLTLWVPTNEGMRGVARKLFEFTIFRFVMGSFCGLCT